MVIDQHEAISAALRVAPNPGLLMLSITGSHAFGIDTPDSDYDFMGVYAIPLRRYLSVCGTGADSIVKTNPDATFHDVTKFCKLAMKGNPTILEMLWTPASYVTPWGERLIAIRKAFLHKGCLNPYFGYYTQQVRRLKTGHSVHAKGGEFGPKFAAHLLRLMYAATHLANTGEVLVHLEGMCYDVVMGARTGAMGVEDVLTKGDELCEQARIAEAGSVLPHMPDHKAINALLYDIRMAFQE